MNIDEFGIRQYTRRIDMTDEELRKHTASLMRISNRKRYVKRIVKQREEARIRKYKIEYLELVKTINSLNDNGYKIKSRILDQLAELENILDYKPVFTLEEEYESN
jgi:hypothetical protein|tara:strand:+ start:480 stop:797 length:318 start_codon:yes stop_codon:yes gene_type:complete